MGDPEMLPPIAYLTLARIRTGELSLQFRGGSGTSLSEAVEILDAPSHADGVAAEYAWLALYEEQLPERIELIDQVMVEHEGSRYDRLQVESAGELLEFYFAVDSFWGKEPPLQNSDPTSGERNPFVDLVSPDSAVAPEPRRNPFLALFEEPQVSPSRAAQQENPFRALLEEAPQTVAAVSEAADPLAEALSELEALVGLEPVKRRLQRIVNRLLLSQRRSQMGLQSPPISLHMVFHGPPGTGKTTVARVVARLFSALGLLDRGHLIETDRSGLVASYAGQTALKTREICEEARGGVLFVDEAYALASDHASSANFGGEALTTLVKVMEDRQGEFALIFAGYTREMQQFASLNPGLISRVGHIVEFGDYSIDELLEVLERRAAEYQLVLSAEARERARTFLSERRRVRGASFGNAREVRHLLEAIQGRQADRLADCLDASKFDLSQILAEDVPEPEKAPYAGPTGLYL